jgi:hypothetical protein
LSLLIEKRIILIARVESDDIHHSCSVVNVRILQLKQISFGK